VDTVLVVNAGSSSVKFQVFGIDDGGGLSRLIKGQIDGIGSRPRLRAEDHNKQPLVDRGYSDGRASTVPEAINEAGKWLRELHRFELFAVGHRVVHGGPEYSKPILVDRDVLARLERFNSLAPLHQPNNLAPIRALLESRPDLPQVACFDTAFHRSHSPLADHFAIPERFYEEGVRRYGFHGLSYEYVADRLKQIAPEVADKRVIIAHLGSGASMCGLANGRSVESTMGFTALDGIPMGTRPGQIDPGVVLYLIAEKGMTAAEVESLLYRECGLKGLSGFSNDVRELSETDDPRAAFAIEYFAYRVGLHAGMLAAALGGLDAFVFTAGIGENSRMLRTLIAEKIKWLGVSIDYAANAAGKLNISSERSRVGVFVIPTDEELMIAKHTLALLAERRRAGVEEAVRPVGSVVACKW
jgi:acetate kinase